MRTRTRARTRNQQQLQQQQNQMQGQGQPQPNEFDDTNRPIPNTNASTSPSQYEPSGQQTDAQALQDAIPIRRVRHSEVVLVDEVAVHYNKYWLRLIWPGSRGGVAGYIVLGGTNSGTVPNGRVREWKERLRGTVGGIEHEGSGQGVNIRGLDERITYDGGNGRTVISNNVNANSATESPIEEMEQDDHDLDDHNNDSDNESIVDDPDLLGGVGDSNSLTQFTPRCESTGLYFPSTTTMELLATYDDGIDRAPSISSIADQTDDEGGSGEPVFCRICREGIHDVDYDFEMEGQGQPSQEAGPTNPIDSRNATNNPTMGSTAMETINPDVQDPAAQPDSEMSENRQRGSAFKLSSPRPVRAKRMNHPYAANPLISPCECAGSMAFVHYLCIEQWRCRSHHPAAKNGLNCETCNASYTLPPPPSRPDVNEEEDWLEAMPPHVLAALRRPHLCWQIGAAVVRRKWLRPIAPVITSPIVALYCRARRTLKKRGVSRRRWACSLCRRRARWKCVRCLRSYYCSRQCQNVSWHIVHKHVCYKPVRFWWSVVVYGLAFVYFLPGVLSYPLMYDLSLTFLWLSFVVMGIIGGGVATILKKRMGIDIRGRGLEALVVVMTFWLANICWGLIWAYFGDSEECKGVFNYNFPPRDQVETSTVPDDTPETIGLVSAIVRYFILKPSKVGLVHLDRVLLKIWPISKWMCTADEGLQGDSDENPVCLQLTRNADPDFMTGENGENCTSDVNTVVFFWAMAVCMHGINFMLKSIDRHRRAAAAAARHPRPHQD